MLDNREYRGKIEAWAADHRQDLIEDLSDLIRIDSTKQADREGMPFGRGTAEALACMQDKMNRYGLRTRNYENYCIAGDLDGTGDKKLDILAHLDVVPASGDWKKTQPFTPLVEGSYLYGRGAADDKGPALAALYAMRAIRELGLPLAHGARLICGADEECGSQDLDYYYGLEEEAEYTFSPDANFPLINIEKARLEKKLYASLPKGEEGASVRKIEAGSKSNVVPGDAEAVFAGLTAEQAEAAVRETEEKTGAIITLQADGDGLGVHVKGQTGHAAMPSSGSINALTALLDLTRRLPLADNETNRVLRALAALFPFGDFHGQALGVDLKDEESGELTISLDMLSLKEGELTADFDCRAPLCATEENLTAVIRQRALEAGLTMEEGGMTPAHYVSADSPLVKTLLACYERGFGKAGKPLAIGGGTYVHELKRGVAFGCEVEGVDNHMHGDDEFVDLDVLEKSIVIFADAILQLCG